MNEYSYEGIIVIFVRGEEVNLHLEILRRSAAW